MDEPIRLFVGLDRKEAVAHHVFAHSVQMHASRPVMVAPLYLPQLDGYAEWHTDGSNEFVYSRFLVPWLCGFEGWAIFADGDMLMRGDIAELWAQRDPTKAVQVVQHSYETKHPTKYLGAPNEDYPRKNWSSVILWNCGHHANYALTPRLVQTRPGSYLHRFSWLENSEIGVLSKSWNWLVGEYPYDRAAKLVHFTIGVPCFREYAQWDYADEWFDTLRDMLAVQGEVGLTWMR